jgi:hypothetical protein
MISGMGAQSGGHAAPGVGGMGGGAGQPTVNGMGSGQPGANGVSVNPQTQPNNPLKGAEISQQNKDGTYTTIPGLSTTAQGSLDLRKLGHAANEVMSVPVQNGIKPYIGAGLDPNLQLGQDIFKAHRGDKDAQKRLVDVSLALRLASETSAAQAKQIYGNPTGEQQKDIMHGMLGNLANYSDIFTRAIPKKYAQKSLDEYYRINKEAFEAEKKLARSGMAETTTDKPHYAGQQQPQYQLKKVNGKAQMVPVMGASQESPKVGGMGGGKPAPKWNHSDDEYNAWLKSQGGK